VRSALETVDGVEETKIDYQKKTATVTYTSDATVDELIAALEKAGYGGSVKR
jgi:copper chaperone CopZ